MAGKIVTLPLSAITHDPVCKRLRPINANYVKDLEAIALAEIKAGTPPVKVFSGSPFPRIVVRALPLKEGDKRKDGTVLYEAQRYGIVQGNHRFRAADGLRRNFAPKGNEEMEVELREYKSDAEALSDAIADNLSNGLHLNKDDRDDAIRVLHFELKVSQAELVKRFKMSKASISRICTKKQRKDGPRKKATKKAKGSGSAVKDAIKARGFAAPQYIKELRSMNEVFSRYSEEIAAAIKDMKPFLTAEFGEMVSDLSKK